MQHSAVQLRDLLPVPFVALNPNDLAAGKYAEGQAVTVSAGERSVTLVVRADPAVQPGSAWIPYGLTGLPAEMLGSGRGEPVSVSVAIAQAAPVQAARAQAAPAEAGSAQA
jgi:anaerobic selenocysteine-containing dehydrogenase